MRAWEERINNAEMVLVNWMREKRLSYTTPDDCMDELIRMDIYPEPNGKARALAFRNDLRSLRETYGMPYETEHLRFEQEAEHKKWYIYLK